MDTMSTPEAMTAVGAATWVVSYALRRLPGTSVVWTHIPERWRWLVPLVLAGVLAGLEAYQGGRALQQAAWVTLVGFLTAVGGHKTATDAPGPYNTKPAPTDDPMSEKKSS